MVESWMIEQLLARLEEFERAACAAGLSKDTVRTYVGRSSIFIRWLAGEYEFQGPR